jgi:pimeloyl-ACP methyl ester carboxylesterase
MLLSLEASHSMRAATAARVLFLNNHLINSASIDEAAAVDIGPIQASAIFPAGVYTPRMYFAYNRDAFVFAVGGCPSPSCAARLLSGYGEANRADSLLGMHPLVEEIMEAMRGYIVAMGLLHGNKYGHWCGHSFGGSIATALALAFAAQAPRSINSVVTFGEPRTCTRATTPVLRAANIDKARFFNARDPIALLPPHLAESAYGFQYLSVATMTNMNRWMHNGLGWHVRDDGGLVAADAPDPSAVPATISLAGWASGLLVDPVNEHSIARYDGKFASQYQRAVAGSNPDPLQAIPPGHGTPIEPADIPIHVLQGRKPSDPPKVILQREAVTTSGPPPSSQEKPFYAARGQNGWFVWHLDQPLVSCRGGREARKMAGRYNSIASQWNRASAGDQAALLSAIEFEFPQE